MNNSKLPAMEEVMPEVYQQLDDVRHVLEKHYKDMQDVEFTVQRGKLYMLQTRTGQRTAPAALKIAVEMVTERLITEAEPIRPIDPHSLDQLLQPPPEPKATRQVLHRRLPTPPTAD